MKDLSHIQPQAISIDLVQRESTRSGRRAARTRNSLHILKSVGTLALNTCKECVKAYGRTGYHLSFGHY